MCTILYTGVSLKIFFFLLLRRITSPAMLSQTHHACMYNNITRETICYYHNSSRCVFMHVRAYVRDAEVAFVAIAPAGGKNALGQIMKWCAR